MGLRQLKVTKSITNRDSVCLDKYLLEISKIALLSPQEEVALTQQIHRGEDVALQALVKANLRFVVSVAKQYQFRGFPLSDLINEGNIGLVSAAKNFDESKGFKFISYAVWWIRQSIIKAINDKSRMVRIPGNKLSLSNRVLNASCQLEQQLEREPSAEEIAIQLKLPVEDVRRVKGSSPHVSLDSALMGEGIEGSLLDQVSFDRSKTADSDKLHKRSLQIEITRCLAPLSAIQKEILCLFFGLEQKTATALPEIAEKLNLSEERIRQIKNKALRQLRVGNRNQLLKSFLG